MLKGKGSFWLEVMQRGTEVKCRTGEDKSLARTDGKWSKIVGWNETSAAFKNKNGETKKNKKDA